MVQPAVDTPGSCGVGTGVLPRVIWCLWLQGPEEAPDVVQRCVTSWRRRNPQWTVEFLDQCKARELICFDPEEPALRHLGRAQVADLIRLDLLANHGGVWVDATCLCTNSLDDWLFEYMPVGFFAFRRPARDRVLSNWFLAATPGHPLIVVLLEQLLQYWRRCAFQAPGNVLIGKILNALLSHSVATTRAWFSPLVTHGLRAYPYFVFHYLFARLVATDQSLGALWNQVPQVSSDGPHHLQRCGLLAPLDDDLRTWLRNGETPVHKLTWKLGVSRPPAGSVLEYALQVAAMDSA